MSYDLYCYRSTLGTPTPEEADAVIAADQDKWGPKDPATKLAIVKALVAFNPLLTATDFQYGDITQLTVDIIEKETKRFAHIDINVPEEEPYLLMQVYDSHVFITTTYGYHGEQAENLFRDIKAYINVIRQTAGYLVSDPQAGVEFDPAVVEFDGLKKYLYTSRLVPGQPPQEPIKTPTPVSKPWWKIW